MISGEYFAKAIKPFVNNVQCDVLGNIIAHRSGEGKRIMLVAHHDVVCLMVTYIDEKGFLYVQPSGGVDASILPARRVMIKHGDNNVPGIIGKKPIHLSREEQNNKITYDNLWIDIGAKSQTDALTMVSKGDYAYFCSCNDELPNGLISDAYFDNQVGIKVILTLAEQLFNTVIPWDVYFVASNHEEIGMRGAMVAANSITPDVCICLDVTHATDYPTMNVTSYGDIKLGEGCVLAKGPDISPRLFNKLENIAICHKIPYQIEVSPYPTGTDANMIQLAGNGAITALVSIPCRYIHTPHEVCAKSDIASATSIVMEFLRDYDL